MFDIFYTGPKPDLFVFEKPADDIKTAAEQSRTEFFWFIDGNNDYTGFDFNWQPAPWDDEYIHVFPNQWHDHGDVYFVKKNYTDENKFKFQKDQCVKRVLDVDSFDIFYQGIKPGLFDHEQPASSLAQANSLSTKKYFWFIDGNNDYSNFDFSWFPNKWELDYVHVFPNFWNANGGVYFSKKTFNNIFDIKFQNIMHIKRKEKPDIFYIGVDANSLEEADAKSTTEFFWFISPDNDYTNFKFDWTCSADDTEYTHVFPSQWHANGGVFYAKKGYANKNKIKFQIAQSVKRNANLDNWIIPDNVDTSGFDFTWHPNPLEDPYEYHFPTQWQKDGGPVYKGTAGIKYVATQKAYTTATQIFYVDFLNPQSKEQFERLKAKYPDIKLTRYVDSHLNVLRRIVNQAESKFVWVISSICDYGDLFDFTWHPEHWQEEMIHVFPSGQQKRGDTFYINVDSFKTQQYDLEILDWFNVINYCNDQKVYRFETPVVNYYSDDLIEQIKNYNFKFPYATFTNLEHGIMGSPDPCLWSEKDRIVQSWAPSNATCVVPKDIKIYLKNQVYDYPHVERLSPDMMNRFIDPAIDIVYISNGEPEAERWYKHLENLLDEEEAGFPTLKYQNTLHRVSNVNGRMAAYKAAAEKSTTPWFFAVFAKLEVAEDFDWNWQPDYWQEPKHYIFNSRNPVNGLEYGHMGMIAYNKKLVLDTVESGLDFTLSKAHEVVPIVSGTAHFNQDAWTTWRTAFREVVKLKHFSTISPTIETAHRLKKWQTVANGNFADWCLKGAADAVEYYESVNGDYDKLMLTYEWAFLRKYFDNLYK